VLGERSSSPTEEASNKTNINTNNTTEPVQLGAAPCSALVVSAIQYIKRQLYKIQRSIRKYQNNKKWKRVKYFTDEAQFRQHCQKVWKERGLL
jgi:hypothetical protein